MREIKHPEYIPVHIILILGAIFMLFPFVWMICTSFKSTPEVLSSSEKIVILPDSIRPSFLNDEDANKRLNQHKKDVEEWRKLSPQEQAKPENQRKKPFEWWDNYKEALRSQPFGRFFLNTLFVSITVTAVSLFFASLAAYAFAFFNFPYKNLMFMLILGTMMLPQQALLIPNYIALSKIHWINTYMALTVPWFASAYAVFFLRQFFMQLPKDLFEAAIIDGCSRFKFYYMVALPLCKPSMVTMGVFSFLSNWNAFVWPLIVTNDTNLRVIQVGLSYFSSDAGNEWGQLMAASTMTILPLVIMYFFAQKQFVESQATSGMKE